MIRVFVADDHAIVREGIKQILADAPDVEVVGEAATGPDALRAAREGGFNIIILDMSMPGRSGIELLKDIRRERPELRVLVLSMHNEDQYAVRAIKAGAQGYLTKMGAPAELVAAVRKVAAGRPYLTSAVAEHLAMSVAAPEPNLFPHSRLSDREYQVFILLAEGRTVTEIAESLFLSSKTVSTHKARILQKMGLGSLAELIRYALQHNLTEGGHAR
jgi:DNA-binding NarL/FixJ family response regulator